MNEAFRSRLSHGLWNFAEQGLTRALDAALTILLVWLLPKDDFALLAQGQAWVAPCLMFFFSPALMLVRNYREWALESRERQRERLRGLRALGFLLALLALLLSFALAWVFPAPSQDWTQKFSLLLWAFSLNAGIYLTGADREMLRMELRTRVVTLITFFQKALLIVGTILAIRLAPGRFEWLAAASILSFSLASVAASVVLRSLLGRPAKVIPDREEIGIWLRDWRRVFAEFSLPQQLCGVIFNWAQSMDLFFLSLFRVSPSAIGSYAVALKLGNFALAVPQAANQAWIVWSGRKHREPAEEGRMMLRFTWAILVVTALLFVLILGLRDPLIDLLSRGRWSAAEKADIGSWLQWILLGALLLALSFPINTWLTLRANLRQALLRVYLPWGVTCVVIYAATAAWGGAPAVARANVAVAASCLAFLFRFYALARNSAV